ncbi:MULTISPECIES: iron dependent repressor, metal binding and dimerization domain protein [unclassified Clostridium]|uniref:metal-dependent transcriptional regulator n=1 Tax=unclassified Clostridium TaxID=2614128 RepID=UPI001105BCB4|nr:MULTISPECIES: iron dependent repressor, metal binding and dimerization domain protein [unclassified Clostridium]
MAHAENEDFRTLKGYDLNSPHKVTYAMEDYLEMICRYTREDGYARISTLSQTLHVKPSSSSKMVQNLKDCGLVDYEKYGIIKLTQEGTKLGEYLLYRHETLNRFFCLLNHSQGELELTEQIEHYITRDTLQNIEKLNALLTVIADFNP